MVSIFVSLCIHKVCWVWNSPCSALYVIVYMYTHTFSFKFSYYQSGFLPTTVALCWGGHPYLIQALAMLALNHPDCKDCYPKSRWCQIKAVLITMYHPCLLRIFVDRNILLALALMEETESQSQRELWSSSHSFPSFPPLQETGEKTWPHLYG
jgi:hypothetical protein